MTYVHTQTQLNKNTTTHQVSAGKGKVTNTDITIVGAGPIGLSMCQALRDTGLKIQLIEKQSHENIANPQPDGREIAITHHTKQLIEQLDQWRQLDKNAVHHLKKAEVYNGKSAFALNFNKPELVHGKSIETLGYLLSNYQIRKSAYKVLETQIINNNDANFLTAKFEQEITKVTTNKDHTEVQLATGEIIHSKLLLAADSRFSFTRKSLGISADMHDFGRTVLLFRCKHTLSNQHVAHEGFYYGKTLAVLPLGEYESSMVITIDNAKIADILKLSEKELAGEMMTWLGGSLGNMTVVSDIFQYPLLVVHANRFYANRSALIGDAAVGMHPVTAHGYNLGMESVEILSNLIGKAINKKQDIGNASLLRAYHRRHTLKTRPLYHGTNSIVKLYTNDQTGAKLLRHLGLRVGDNFTPVKKLITAQLTG